MSSLSCAKAQGSGCFLLVLEQASSSFVALCQLFSWSEGWGVICPWDFL